VVVICLQLQLENEKIKMKHPQPHLSLKISDKKEKKKYFEPEESCHLCFVANMMTTRLIYLQIMFHIE
jgi:hypothetical protein